MVVVGRFKQNPVYELSAKKSGRCREVANRREGADSGEVAVSGVLAVIEEVPG